LFSFQEKINSFLIDLVPMSLAGSWISSQFDVPMQPYLQDAAVP
jgi:hypothetical protein